MIGTEGYSPPEQYRGEATPMADIYAMGATIHHALTRRDPRLEPPFSFSERPLRRINPSVSAELEVIVNRALEYDPASRFQTAAEMRDALHVCCTENRRIGPYGSTNGTDKIQTASNRFGRLNAKMRFAGRQTFFRAFFTLARTIITCMLWTAAEGKFQWKYPTDGGIVSRPAMIDGNVYIGSEDKRLHVVSARSGKVVWTYYTDGPIRSSPRIAEGHVFIGSDDNYLHAVNIATGRMVWRFETADAVRSTPFVMNDMVYFGCESGDYYAVNFRGELKWRFQGKTLCDIFNDLGMGRRSIFHRWIARYMHLIQVMDGCFGVSVWERRPSVRLVLRMTLFL